MEYSSSGERDDKGGNTAVPHMQPSENAYCRRQRGGASLLVREDGASIIEAALVDGEGCQRIEAVGRGEVFCFPWLPGHFGVVRHCLRGGLARVLLRDRYVLVNRPLNEFRVHARILALGVPAPGLLGVCWRRRGIFYSGALATEAVDAPDMDAWLRAEMPSDEARTIRTLHDCGQLVRLLHDKGVYHADLQIKNILVCAQGPMLLDFDGARIRTRLGHFSRMRNLLRLRRSLEKRGHPSSLFDRVREGYGDAPPPEWLALAYALKGRVSDWMHCRRNRQS